MVAPLFLCVPTVIFYETDEEYRRLLCRFIQNNKKNNNNNNNRVLDAEAAEYNDDDMVHLLDDIYAYTKENPLFQEIYDLAAAGCMMSVDREFGVCILLSYHYLPFFYPCLLLFHQDPGSCVKTHPLFHALFQQW